LFFVFINFIDLIILDLQVEEWITKGNSFVETVKNFRLISKRLVELPNFSAVQELFPYVWDLLGIFETCAGYISWLGKFFKIN
jgi:tryptophan-rich sensory protein